MTDLSSYFASRSDAEKYMASHKDIRIEYPWELGKPL
jgi:hypothetical protein